MGIDDFHGFIRGGKLFGLRLGHDDLDHGFSFILGVYILFQRFLSEHF